MLKTNLSRAQICPKRTVNCICRFWIWGHVIVVFWTGHYEVWPWQSVLNLEPAFPLRLLHSVEDKRLKGTRIGITGSELLKEPGPDGGCRNTEHFPYMLFFYCRTEYLIGTHSCNIAAVVGMQQWTLFWLCVWWRLRLQRRRRHINVKP